MVFVSTRGNVGKIGYEIRGHFVTNGMGMTAD
ncbi:hypothetical protein FHS14_001422 [Paenibacillus baekrokdamisoli]|nr:hypothetical protein [Paenibacillus baekrokdamisoli]